MIARFGLEDDKDVRYVDMSEVAVVRGLHVHRDKDKDLVASIYLVMKDQETELTLERVLFEAEYKNTNVRRSIFAGGGFIKELVKVSRDDWESCDKYLEMEEQFDYLIDMWRQTIKC